MTYTSNNEVQKLTKDLLITYSDSNLSMVVHPKISRFLLLLSLFELVISLILGLLFLIINSSTGSILLLSVTPNTIIIAIILLFSSLIINILAMRYYFKRKNYSSYLHHLNLSQFKDLNSFYLMSLLLAISLNTYFNMNFISAFICFLFGTYMLLSLQVSNNTIIEIVISKKDGLFNFSASEVISFTKNSPKWLRTKNIPIQAHTKKLNLAILQNSKDSILTEMKLKRRKLLNYSFLDLQQAEKYAKQRDSFKLFLVNDKIVIDKIFGVLLGDELSINEINVILNNLTEFKFFQVVKLENTSKEEFVEYCLSHPQSINNLTNLISIAFIAGITLPIYIGSVLVAFYSLFEIIVAPLFPVKLFFLLVFLACDLIIILPYYIWKWGKAAKQREENQIQKILGY